MVTYNTTVPPGAEVSFEYRFTPSDRLDPIELRLAATVFYEDDVKLVFADFCPGV